MNTSSVSNESVSLKATVCGWFPDACGMALDQFGTAATGLLGALWAPGKAADDFVSQMQA